ncbi:MAG: GNAT family N-acetyltransferase [Bryobacterales bacterium]|nr:GNAT family N-acetyltransferase [Bryobacterales bacterium]
MISDGYSPLAPGKLAAAVTYLEMTAFPPATPFEPPNGFVLQRRTQPDPDWYRALFQTVGAPWLWFGRLAISDPELTAILWNRAVEVYALTRNGEDVGLLELDGRISGEMELAYLGLARQVIGCGAGRFLMQFAVARAAQLSVTRFLVHTCTLDHPDALRIYMQAGFRPYKRAIEVFDDPRLIGLLPLDAAPQVPLLNG